ncbi:hypothetical protein DL764_005225 [Monosporascus ibericus]|uniref:NACHT-NTPase and P-loop NTPases N-terminal domain-containing protein n=1 Tax=Monosporascus ibericus TaxID=155417 RepID=A0A4V1XAN1_9PEZI|nr:hypothetical protein DL764_005225 [Monosporascus ibericus]
MVGINIETLLSDTLGSVKNTAELCGSIHSTEGLAPIFQEAPQCIDLLQQILQSVQDQLAAGALDTDDDDLSDSLKTTKKEVKHLESIYRDIAPEGATSRVDRYQAAVRKPGMDRVEVLLLRLLEVLNDLVEDGVIKTTAEHTKALSDAIDKLSAMEPSVPDEKSGFHHSGSGDMYNNTGLGTQNINKGRGTQNIAKTMRIGK